MKRCDWSLAACAVLAFCGESLCAAAPGRGPAPLPVVLTSPAVKLTTGYAKRYPGYIRPVQEVAVIPRVTGTIQKILFKEGETVRRGQLLFEIEDVTYKAKVDAARASLAQIRAASRLSKTNYTRQHTLLKSKAISQSVFDEAEEQRDTSNAKLLAAEAELRDAENTLSYTRIFAPITGRIGKCSLTPGNLVSPSSGTIVTITMTSPIYVEFAVGESIFRKEFGGMKKFPEKADIRVELADGKMHPDAAKVAIIEPTVDRTTNTIRVWGIYPNADGELLAGSYVTVHLGVRNPSAMVAVVPSALQLDKNGPYVYVLNSKGVAERRAVMPGNVSGDLLEVRGPVKPGETVVVDGMHKLRPGAAAQAVPYKK